MADKTEKRRVLAVETSTLFTSVALCEDGRAVAELSHRLRPQRSDALLGDAQGLLDHLSWRLADLDGFVVSLGPGSFTGVRVGVATCRALAWSLSRPLVGLSSLDLLAMNAAGRPGRVATLLDARKKELYFAVYRFVEGEAEPRRELGPDVASHDDVWARLSASARPDEPTWLLGDGVLACPERFTEGCFPGARVAEDTAHQGRAAALGGLGHRRLLVRGYQGGFAEVEPLYVRPSEAELAAQRRQEKA